ncbi:MAG: ABC transporter permease, partial [Sedimentibacter sp.]
MLFMACISPLLFGLFIRFGIPFTEKLLTVHFNEMEILYPYYLLFDLFLATLTPIMFSFVSAMVILGEIDDGITSYMSVTPLGKGGYLVSRVVFPLIFSFFITIIVLYKFSLTEIPLGIIVGVSILSSILGFIMTMLVVSISSNRVEGMAVMKLSGILMIGIPAPFFISESIQCLLFILPSLWISKFVLGNSEVYFIVCITISIGWIMILLKRFMKKIF